MPLPETKEMEIARRALSLADTLGHGNPPEQTHAEAKAIIAELGAMPHTPLWFCTRACADWIALMASSGSVARAKFEIYAKEAAEKLRVLLHQTEQAA